MLIPHENVKDLSEIPDTVKAALRIEPVRWIEEALRFALERMPEALPEPVIPAADNDAGTGTARAH